MEYEQLVFFTQDPSSANPANIEADDGTQYDPALALMLSLLRYRLAKKVVSH